MTDRTGFRFGAHVMKSENVSSSTAALALPGRGLKSQAYVDHDELSSPPPSDAEGRILRVDFRYTLFFVGSINTRDCTATIKFGVVLYWTDSRLAGFESAILPATLWGPDLYLRNGVGGVLKECEQFAVTDVAIGRLKRILNFEATIVLPMDLSAFPFDTQSVRPELVSISHWSQCAGPRFGSLAHGQSYTLHPVSRANEGRLIWMMWDGRMPEWELHSYAIQTACSHHLAGFVLMLLCLDLYVTRKHGFYFEKARMRHAQLLKVSVCFEHAIHAILLSHASLTGAVTADSSHVWLIPTAPGAAPRHPGSHEWHVHPVPRSVRATLRDHGPLATARCAQTQRSSPQPCTFIPRASISTGVHKAAFATALHALHSSSPQSTRQST